MRKVLLASLNAGGGHHALRDSFARALTSVDPSGDWFKVTTWDSSDRVVNWFYSLCVHSLTRFQGAVHELSSRRWAVDLAVRLSPQLLVETERMLRREEWDTVISTHALLSMAFVKAKRRLGVKTAIVNAIPDYGAPTSAFNPPQADYRPDSLIVMAEDTLRHYLDREGIPAARVHRSGFLAAAPFQEAGRRRALPLSKRADERANLLMELRPLYPQLSHIQPERPTLLFTGGSAWTEKTLPVLDALAASPYANQLNVIIVCGKNERFAEVAAARFGDVALFGYAPTETYARLMALADFPVLGSLAPASMQELLEARCGPLFLFHIIPGAERPHAAYIEAERIGVYEPNPARMVEILAQATGLKPAEARLEALIQGFPQRAREIRAANATRARDLPSFLEHVVGGADEGPKKVA